MNFLHPNDYFFRPFPSGLGLESRRILSSESSLPFRYFSCKTINLTFGYFHLWNNSFYTFTFHLQNANFESFNLQNNDSHLWHKVPPSIHSCQWALCLFSGNKRSAKRQNCRIAHVLSIFVRILLKLVLWLTPVLVQMQTCFRRWCTSYLLKMWDSFKWILCCSLNWWNVAYIFLFT